MYSPDMVALIANPFAQPIETNYTMLIKVIYIAKYHFFVR